MANTSLSVLVIPLNPMKPPMLFEPLTSPVAKERLTVAMLSPTNPPTSESPITLTFALESLIVPEFLPTSPPTLLTLPLAQKPSHSSRQNRRPASRLTLRYFGRAPDSDIYIDQIEIPNGTTRYGGE